MRRLRLGDVRQEKEPEFLSDLSHEWDTPFSPVQNCFFMYFRWPTVTMATVKIMVRPLQKQTETLDGVNLGKEALCGPCGVADKLLFTNGIE